MVTFSIIIPTYSRNHLLSKCLDNLTPGKQEPTIFGYEVIVTDDSVHGDARILIEQWYSWAKWVKGPGRGPAANRNNGSKYAVGKWLIFTDDDCIPQASLLRAYENALIEFPASKAFEGSILPDNWAMLKKDMAECPINITGNCFWSANIMVSKALFENIGGFDEQFKIAAQEDQDIYIRLKCLTQIQFCERAIVMHPVRIVTLYKKIKLLTKVFDNWTLYYKKHNDTSLKKQLLISVFDYLKFSIISFKHLKFKRSLYYLVSSFYCLKLVIFNK